MSRTELDLTGTEKRHRNGQHLTITAAEIRAAIEHAERSGRLVITEEIEDALAELENAADRDRLPDFNSELRHLITQARRECIDLRWS